MEQGLSGAVHVVPRVQHPRVLSTRTAAQPSFDPGRLRAGSVAERWQVHPAVSIMAPSLREEGPSRPAFDRISPRAYGWIAIRGREAVTASSSTYVSLRPRTNEDPMKRHLRARVQGGNLAPTEPVALPEGMIVELTLETPEPPETRSRITFRPRDLGVRQPLTREAIYDDVG